LDFGSRFNGRWRNRGSLDAAHTCRNNSQRSPGDGNVYGRRFTITGIVGSLIEIAVFEQGQSNPRAGYHPGRGRYRVTWKDNRFTNRRAYGRFLAAAGQLLGEPFQPKLGRLAGNAK
jgi:hypothetical protein